MSNGIPDNFDAFMSQIIGTGVEVPDSAPGAGDGYSDAYRPELADAVNEAGDPFYNWLSTNEGQNPDGTMIGIDSAVRAWRAPTTREDEPTPLDQMPNTQVVFTALESRVPLNKLTIQTRERIRDALLRRSLNPAAFLQPDWTPVQVLEVIEASYNGGHN